MNIPDGLKEMAAEAQQRIRLFDGTPIADADQRVLYLIERITAAESVIDDLIKQFGIRTSKELLIAGKVARP